jgi:hypothetical protein
VKALPAVLLLLAADGRAAAAYVTDELVLGVYAEQGTQGQRLTTLHSGASVETLATSGESTRVRLPDGMTGWVKTAYLTNSEPATVRIKQLQAELDRSRATSPALAEAAERSEVERLTRELALEQAALSAAHGNAGAPPAPQLLLWPWIAAVCCALACGFWLGYATLARRVKGKFGGIKVY